MDFFPYVLLHDPFHLALCFQIIGAYVPLMNCVDCAHLCFGYFMYLCTTRFNIQKFIVMPVERIYVFHIVINKKQLCHYTALTNGFYNAKKVCITYYKPNL